MTDTDATSAGRHAPGLLCPACRVDLVMSDRQGVEIDYCPRCRGVWLDRGELDKIIERSAAYEAGLSAPPPGPQPQPGMAPGSGQPWGGERAREHGSGHGGGHGGGRHGGGHGGRRRGFLGGLFDD